MLVGFHGATRKTAHPLLNVPATICSSFQLSVIPRRERFLEDRADPLL